MPCPADVARSYRHDLDTRGRLGGGEAGASQASASKEAFIRVWNLVAAQYGIQLKSPGTF